MNNLQTVLIVEDQPHHLRLIRDNLIDAGYNTIEATNVEDALKQIREQSGKSQPPRVVLIDVGIPESRGAETSREGGITLLRRLHDEEKMQIPAIFVTIWAEEPPVKKAAQKYKVPIVPKPLDIDQLLRETRKALRRKQQGRL